MLPISLVIFLIGICACVSGMRGRLLNTHPHCRGCRFDLDGIELDSTTRCPECGRLISTGGSSVRIGLRKKRPAVLVLGLLLTLIGTGGLSYPLWSQIPAWKNIDWYEHLPESMLISMSTRGNAPALSELYARMITDSLSDAGLNRMLTFALSRIEDESQEWDEQWGDVIVWCMLTSQMTHEQVGSLAETTMYAEIRTRPVIRASDDTIGYTLGVYGKQRGAAVSFLHSVKLDAWVANDWERFLGRKNPWSIEVSTEQVWIDQPPRIEMSGAWMNLNEWVPVDEAYFEHAALVRLPGGSQASIILNSNARFKLRHKENEVHSWDQTLTATVALSEEEVQYAVPFTDPDEIDRYVSTLNASYVQYPRNRMLGRLIEGTKDCQWARTITVHSLEKPLDGSISALFDLYVRVDSEEILFTSLTQGADQSLEFERGWSESRNMLDYFDEHQELWSRAEEQGHVDLILRPNPDLAAQDPRHTQYIDAEVIFREVPLMILEPSDTGRPSPAGTTWSWVQVPRDPYPFIKGELIKD